MLTISYKMLLLVLWIFFLNACSEDWGIDHQSIKIVPTCVGDSSDAVQAQALTVNSGAVISEINGEAKLRIWHFQNTTKAVCVLSGEAIIESITQEGTDNE